MSSAGKKTRRIFDQRFELIGELGRGKKSVVYHALHDGKDGADVALKVLLPVKTLDPLKNRLRAEAQAMLMAQHPYVLGLKDFQYYENLSYIALEYAPLGDLRKYARAKGGRLPQTQVELFLRQISEALHFIHSLGLIHRDVKPDNILAISPDEVRLADFGVSLILDNPGISADLNAAIGTMDYLAPEVLEGKEYGPQGDIYSLGVTAYELISGIHPFADLPLANMMEARIRGPQPLDKLIPEISPSLAQTIGVMLESDTSKRFKKASEIIDSLNSPPAKKTAKSKNANFFKDDEISKAAPEKTPSAIDDGKHRLTDEEQKIGGSTDLGYSNNEMEYIAGVLKPEGSQVTPREDEDSVQQLPPTLQDEEELDSNINERTHLDRDDQAAKVRRAKDSIINSAIWGDKTSEDNLDEGQEQVDIEDVEDSTQGLLPRTLRATQVHQQDGIDGITPKDQTHSSRGQGKLSDTLKSKVKGKSRLSNKNSPEGINGRELEEDYNNSSNLDRDKIETPYQPRYRLRAISFRLLLLMLIALAAMGVYKALFSSAANTKPALHLKPEVVASRTDNSTVVSTEEGQTALISQFKQGIYKGSLTGVLTSTPLPLFLDVKENGIFVFLGVQGWTPVRADIIDKDMFEISSNGLVLSLKITGKDFSGTVQDLLSGETGTWSIQRQIGKN